MRPMLRATAPGLFWTLGSVLIGTAALHLKEWELAGFFGGTILWFVAICAVGSLAERGNRAR